MKACTRLDRLSDRSFQRTGNSFRAVRREPHAQRACCRLKDGTVEKGRSHVSRRLEDGTEICVIYDAEKPRRNRRYPMDWYRVAQN